jgi:hypothetical protein
MATKKQTQAAKRNVKKAQQSASAEDDHALPAEDRTALGKHGRPWPAQAHRRQSPKTRAEL